MPKFDFERIVILESLTSRDFLKTGEELANYLKPMISEKKSQPLVEFERFNSRYELKAAIERLTYEIINGGKIPLLHIETHGSEFGSGLVLSDNSILPWSELNELCVHLNKATRFNLILIIAACYSGDLWENEFRLDKPSSYGLLIAPSDGAFGHEMLGGFRSLYRELLDNDNAWYALGNLVKLRLEQGSFLVKAAHECFFATLNKMYLRMGEREEMKKMLDSNDAAVMRRYGYLGKHVRPLQRKRHLEAIVNLQKGYMIEMFEKFFMSEEIPENEQRFGYIREDLMSIIDINLVYE